MDSYALLCIVCTPRYIPEPSRHFLIVFSTSIIPSFVVYSSALTLSFTCIYTCTLQRGFLEFFSLDFLLQVSSSFPLFLMIPLINFGFPPAVRECSPRLGVALILASFLHLCRTTYFFHLINHAGEWYAVVHKNAKLFSITTTKLSDDVINLLSFAKHENAASCRRCLCIPKKDS
jgi:hypothetical protein